MPHRIINPDGWPVLMALVVGPTEYYYSRIPSFMKAAALVATVIWTGADVKAKIDSDIRDLNTRMMNESSSRAECCQHVTREVETLRRFHLK